MSSIDLPRVCRYSSWQTVPVETSRASSRMDHLQIIDYGFSAKRIFEYARRRKIHLSSKHRLQLLDHVDPVPPAMRLLRIKTDQNIDITRGRKVFTNDRTKKRKFTDAPLTAEKRDLIRGDAGSLLPERSGMGDAGNGHGKNCRRSRIVRQSDQLL